MTAARNIFLFLGKRQRFTARDSCRVSFSEKKKKEKKNVIPPVVYALFHLFIRFFFSSPRYYIIV